MEFFVGAGLSLLCVLTCCVIGRKIEMKQEETNA